MKRNQNTRIQFFGKTARCTLNMHPFSYRQMSPHTTNQQNDMCIQRRLMSLGIHPVWSESSLCAQYVVKGLMFLHANSEASDQTGRMPSLIWVFAGHTDHFVGFVMRQHKFVLPMTIALWNILPADLVQVSDLASFISGVNHNLP